MHNSDPRTDVCATNCLRRRFETQTDILVPPLLFGNDLLATCKRVRIDEYKTEMARSDLMHLSSSRSRTGVAFGMLSQSARQRFSSLF